MQRKSGEAANKKTSWLEEGDQTIENQNRLRTKETKIANTKRVVGMEK
jgi:hypothetical protein